MKHGKSKVALINYMEVAFLGESTGAANAAILLEKQDILDYKSDLNYLTLESQLENDNIYNHVKEIKIKVF